MRTKTGRSQNQSRSASRSITSLLRAISRHRVITLTLAYVTAGTGILHGIHLLTTGLDVSHSIYRWSTIAFLTGAVAVFFYGWAKDLRRSRQMGPVGLIALAVVSVAIGGLGREILEKLENRGRQHEEAGNTSETPNAEKTGQLGGKDPIVILSVMSSGEIYEQVILDSFREHVRKKIEAEGGTLDWKIPIKGEETSPETPEGRKRWDALTTQIQSRYAHSNITFVVGVGSFASTALFRSGLAARGAVANGLIFLGVTDPVGAGLVKSLRGRNENTRIAGVRYGSGPDGYANCLRVLFPQDQSLVFVREENSPQDRFMMSAFKKSDAGRKFGDIVYRSNLNPNVLSDPDAVYFAWYGFDILLNNVRNEAARELLKKKVVPSTFTFENVKDAGIVVSPDDSSIGIAGANLLMDAILGKRALGSFDVVDTPFFYWLDRETLNAKHITLADWVYDKHAKEKKVKSACPQ